MLRLIWLGICAFVYGAGRIALFHPVLNEQYRTWLETTPWQDDKPLPAGPIQQVPQDLIVLIAMMLLTRELSLLVLALPVAFLVGYLAVLAVATRACGQWAFAYLMGFGLGAIGLSAPWPPIACVVAMACYPVAFLAIRRSLRQYPWDFDWNQITKYAKQNHEEIHRDRLGWPHDFMSPNHPQVWLPYGDGVCLSLLLGWFAFVIHFHADPQGRPILCGFIAQFLSMAAVIRVYLYMITHRWPISFWGRIWTLRWIIPRYDVIFVAPLLAEAILLSTQWLAGGLPMFNNPLMNGLPNPVNDWLAIGCSSIGIAAFSLVLLVMGPVLERWRLAGTHRIVFDQIAMGGKSAQSQFVEL
jgi:hypothetical protein